MRRKLGVDRAYGAKKLLVNGRVERAWLSGIAPNVLQLLGSYGLTIYEAIQNGLIHRIGKLDDNVIHLLGESRVPNQCEAELRILSCPVPLSERNKVRTIESCKHGLCRILSFHLAPRITVQEGGHAQPEREKQTRAVWSSRARLEIVYASGLS